MQNFAFHNPTKIIFGEGQIALGEHADVTPKISRQVYELAV